MSEKDNSEVANGNKEDMSKMFMQDVDGNRQDVDDTSSKRTRKQVEDGRQYREHIMDKTIKKCKTQLGKQLQVVEQLLDAPSSAAILNDEGGNLDKLFTNLLEAITKRRELSEDGHDSKHDKTLHDLDRQLFTMKQRIAEAVRTLGIVGVSVASSRNPTDLLDHGASQSNTREKVPVQTEENAREVEPHDEFHKSVSENGSVSQHSHASRSSVKQQAIIAGLEAERKALLNAQEAEIRAEMAKVDEEKRLAIQLKVSQQRTDLLRMEEKIAKVKAMEEIYQTEEMHQEQLSGQSNVSKVSKTSKSTKASKYSHTSSSSRVSNRSSVAKRAELAGLKAEVEAKKKTHQAEIQTEQLKGEASAIATRNTKELTRRLELINLEKKIAKEKAIGKVLNHDDVSKHEQRQQPENVSGPSYRGSLADKRKKSIGLYTDQATHDQHPKDLPDQSGHTLVTQLLNLIKQQAAPDVEIDVFSGDPLEYTYFITNFKEIVERSIDGQTARLNRLIKYTTGEAKELIKHCVHESKADCYDKAINLLNKEYGNKYKICSAYMEELRKWPQIKQNDAAAYKKFYRFSLRCLTLQKRGELEVLNSPISIRQLQLKLPNSQQDKWSKIVETTRRQQGREANFEDFVEFVDFETSVISDPIYAKGGGSEKKPINVNKTAFKSDITSESSEPTRETRNVSRPAPSVKSDSITREPSTLTGSQKEAAKQVHFKKCVVCEGEHDLDDCKQFKDKGIDERKDILYEHELCYACLGKGHISMGCTSRRICALCKKSHPTSMHVKVNSQWIDQNGIIAMCIIPVIVYHADRPEKSTKVYAVVDNCSQGTFATEDLANDLGIEGRQTSITLETAIGQETVQTSALDNLRVRCTDKHRETYPDSPEVKLPTTFTRLSLPADTRDIASKDKALQWDHLKEVASNMAEYDENLPIALLIGLNCPRAQEPYESTHGNDNAPYAVRNALGWCIMGPISSKIDGPIKCNRTRLLFPSTDSAHNIISQHHFAVTETVKDNFIKDRLQEMWMTDFSENNGEEQAMSFEDKRFMDVMSSGVKLKNGKYELPLPLRNAKPLLPESRQQARSRLKSIKRRLRCDNRFREDYTAFMEEIIRKGYAKECTDDNGRWYIPHHGVYHPRKSKIRVVFDCGAQNAGVSLNSELLQGPDLTNSLLGVLMRFRLERVAIMADIESMFYQVKVPEHHRKFIRFFWWPESDLMREPREYEMSVHLFGALSSPSCANFALRQTAADNESELGSETADVLRKDFYVDDLLKSMEDEDEAASMIGNVRRMCDSGGFNLTKFVSNSKRVIESLPPSKLAKSMENFDVLQPKWPIERALGVTWCIESDSFHFRIQLTDTPLTRRGILSSISSIYDPMGLVAPFLLKGRKILQQITSETSRWDDEVGEEYVQEWHQWRRGLPALESLEVPRCHKPQGFGKSVHSSLHCFSDASKIGYGVACYIRQMNEKGRIHVSLVIGKSRVSPLKPVTIPRLELTAATVAAKVANLVKRELSIKNITEFYWTDSQIVLGYIYNEARRFRVFVANRVQQIRDYTDKNQWKYIETKRNPSDAASRGITVDDKEKVQAWFDGPGFLWKKDDEWRTREPSTMVLDNDPEVQSTAYLNVTTLHAEENLLDRFLRLFSDWFKMKRILAIMVAFVKKCQRKADSEPSSVASIDHAGKLLAMMSQQKHLKEHLTMTSVHTRASKFKDPKWLSTLDPFKDENGILRVGGRLRNSEQAGEIKFPIIMPKKGLLTRRIVEWFHKKVGHSGRTTTVNEIRSNGFWIIGMTTVVKSVIFSCVRCRLLRGKLGQQKMADLPLERTLEVAPFTYCGVDVFGPYRIKEGRKVHKRWCSLFTCFSSRAVHLETTYKMDTDSCISALRRFLATRGKVRTIRSDGGTNFVGASNELKKAWKEMDHTKIHTFLQSESCDWITWEWNPPEASHMGGVWERQIRTVRTILSSLLKSHDEVLNDEGFHTLIKEVECIVNSRPLSPEDVNDPSSEVITPNHLLTLKSKAVLPPPGTFTRNDIYCRKRWRVVQHLANEFWCRWRKEYLSGLQTRQKWIKETRNFSVGDVVLLKEDIFSPRNRWPTARVIQAFPNEDGLVRSVDLMVARPNGKTSTLKRPITKLVLLLEAEGVDQ